MFVGGSCYQSSRAVRRSSQLSWSSIVVTSLPCSRFSWSSCCPGLIPVQHHGRSRGSPANSNDISCHESLEHVHTYMCIPLLQWLRLIAALNTRRIYSMVAATRLRRRPRILIVSLVSRYLSTASTHPKRPTPSSQSPLWCRNE